MAASSSVWRGVRYAFGRGLDPRKKDGVRAHPCVLVFGVVLHLAIGAAFVSLLLRLFGAIPPALARVCLQTLLAGGMLSGIALIVRRMRDPVLQAISVSDDYVSALLVLLLLAAAGGSLFAAGPVVPLYVAAAVLVVYAPFGKIRHSVLFFVTRARFGAFIGTRGVLIHRSHG